MAILSILKPSSMGCSEVDLLPVMTFHLNGQDACVRNRQRCWKKLKDNVKCFKQIEALMKVDESWQLHDLINWIILGLLTLWMFFFGCCVMRSRTSCP